MNMHYEFYNLKIENENGISRNDVLIIIGGGLLLLIVLLLIVIITIYLRLKSKN